MLVYDQTIQHTCIVINLYTNMNTLACMAVVKSLTKNLRGQTEGRTDAQTDVNQYTPTFSKRITIKRSVQKTKEEQQMLNTKLT